MIKRTMMMMTVLLAALLWPGHALAADNALLRLFPKKAAVTVPEGSGLVQLSLPDEIQRAVKPDLSDVRLIDRNGTEVPYVMDSSALPWRKRSDTVVERYASLSRVARRKRRKDGVCKAIPGQGRPACG